VDECKPLADVSVTFTELGTAANVTAANAVRVWPAATIEAGAYTRPPLSSI